MAEEVLTKTLIPADLHDRGFIKPWLDKPWTPDLAAEVFKKLDGAESLIGRKIGIPGDDAKPEEVEKFYSSLRAAKPEDYEFKLGEKSDEGFDKELRGAAHDAGLSKAQMAKFVAKLAPGIASRQAAVAEAQQKLDTEFEGIVAATFGAENEKVVARVKEALAEHVPAPLRPHIGKLDNNALAILTGVVNGVILKYTSEDKLNGKDKGAPGASDKAALQKEARDLQGSVPWSDFRHPDHEKTKARVKEIYASAAFK